MTLDHQLTDDFLKQLIDHYTAPELVDVLDLTTEDIIDAFFDTILEASKLLRQDMYND